MGRKNKGGGIINTHIYQSDKISTQQNTNPNFIEAGIIHVCETVAIGYLRGAATDFLNMFGHAGFDNPRFDEVRNKALLKLEEALISRYPDGKISNLRIDFTTIDPQSITVNLYGTLMLPSPQPQPQPQPKPRAQPQPPPPYQAQAQPTPQPQPPYQPQPKPRAQPQP